MTTTIQFLSPANKTELTQFIEKKLQSIQEKYDWLINANIILKNCNDHNPEHKICEIELSVPGPRVFASSKNETYEAAIANTVSNLERLLQKRKAKLTAH